MLSLPRQHIKTNETHIQTQSCYKHLMMVDGVKEL